ncbi:hypothetical protein DAI22_06g066050 [Oryza sativa Japonica Group]|nr:hypothetical protein DAI22_06g066050 [Oryza sativa Japonica Group]
MKSRLVKAIRAGISLCLTEVSSASPPSACSVLEWWCHKISSEKMQRKGLRTLFLLWSAGHCREFGWSETIETSRKRDGQFSTLSTNSFFTRSISEAAAEQKGWYSSLEEREPFFVSLYSLWLRFYFVRSYQNMHKIGSHAHVYKYR